MPEPVTAYLGLGGNVGDVATGMRKALERIGAEASTRVVAASPIYKTPPWGPVEQDWFLNACVAVETELSAPDLLDFVLSVERSLGRVRDVRWGPRTLDIDVLLYGEGPVDLPKLTIPHPRMTERHFVMVPLADIAPDVIVAGKKVSDHASAFADEPLEKSEQTLSV